MTIDITLYITPEDRHTNYLYFGLYKLKEEGFINQLIVIPEEYHKDDRIIIEDNKLKRSRRPYPYCIKAKILNRKTGEIKWIGFDLQDWSNFFSNHCMEQCDIIYKRAYNKEFSLPLTKIYNTSIRPFGFTYPINYSNKKISSIKKWTKYRNWFIYALQNPDELVKKIRTSVKVHNDSANIDSHTNKDNNFPKNEYILFQVMWYDENWSEAMYLNQQRANLIRCLHTEFKDQFLGGMFSNSYIPKSYRDCKSNLSHKRDNYLNYVKNALVTISTNGFGGSLPWKLVEYFKLGKCVVSEKLIPDTPKRLLNNHHLKIFQNNEECISILKELLNNKNEVNQIAKNGKDYFNKYIYPPKSIKSLIINAFECN